MSSNEDINSPINLLNSRMELGKKGRVAGGWKKNILLLLITLFIFFLILEISLRLFSYPVYGFQKGTFTSDENLGYKLSPNYSGLQSIYGRTAKIDTNSKGMRDFREYDYNKSEGTYRILILGDSYSFGNGVDLNESYPEYLRENFKDKNVEVINLAVPGYGINHEYVSFLEEGKKYNPDIILVAFSPNDLEVHQIVEEGGKTSVDKNHSATANKNGFLVAYEGEGVVRSIHLFLLWNCRSYGFFYTKLRAVFSKVVSNYWKKQQGTPLYFSDVNSEQYKEAYNGYFSLIKKLKDSTNATIILFAGPFSIYYASPDEIKKEYNFDYEINPGETKESIKEIANNLSILFVELDTNEKDIYLPVDGHLNSKGNKLVADKLYSEVSRFL